MRRLTATLMVALSLWAAATPGSAAAAAYPEIIREYTYTYAYGYTIYLRLVRSLDGTGSLVRADCLVQGPGPAKRIGACRVYRSDGVYKKSRYRNGWNDVAAFGYTYWLRLRCGCSYQIYIQYRTYGGPWDRVWTPWYTHWC